MKKLIAFLSVMILVSLSTANIFAEVLPVTTATAAPTVTSTEVNAEDSEEDEQENEEDGSEEGSFGNVEPRFKVDEARMAEAKKRIELNRENLKRDLTELKEERKEAIKSNLDLMKVNREQFRTENKEEVKAVFKEIDEETKEKIKELKEDFAKNTEELKEEYKGMEKNAENLTNYREKLAEIRKVFYSELKVLTGDNVEAAEILEKRKEVYLENQELRKENKETRVEYRGERNEMVTKYKTAFLDRLGNRLDKIPNDKLGNVSKKIDELITKIEARTNMSDLAKEKLLSQLAALKDILDSKMQDNEDEADDLDILSILEVE